VGASELFDFQFIVELEDWQLLNALTWDLNDVVGADYAALLNLNCERCPRNFSYDSFELAVISDDNLIVLPHYWWQVEEVNL
jgi:hypothetical protein